MKLKSKIILALLSCALCSFSINAQDDNKGEGTPIIITNTKGEPSTRPHSPSNQQITCTYTEECLFFNFRYPEGLCSLEVTDFESGDITTYTFDSEGEAAVLVGELNNAHLLITTAFGHSYEGDIY